MRRTGHRKSWKFDEERLRAVIALHPDYYLSEISLSFAGSASSVYRTLRRFKISRKKSLSSTKSAMKKNVSSLSGS